MKSKFKKSPLKIKMTHDVEKLIAQAERRKAYAKEYRNRPEVREKHIAMCKAYYANNRERLKQENSENYHSKKVLKGSNRGRKRLVVNPRTPPNEEDSVASVKTE